MSLPCSDQGERPRRMKDVMLPRGVEHLRCWCCNLCKVKEVTDFSNKPGMRFFMCANYEYEPPVLVSPYDRPPVSTFRCPKTCFLCHMRFVTVVFFVVSSAPMHVVSLD